MFNNKKIESIKKYILKLHNDFWRFRNDVKICMKRIICKHEYELYIKVIGERHGKPYDVVAETWRCKKCGELKDKDFKESILYQRKKERPEI